jgi:rare lipoprotein A
MRGQKIVRKSFLVILAVLILVMLFDPYPVSAADTGVASYYSYECASLPMANGKPFDPEKRTCASWFYKFGTVLLVKSLDTGRSTEVVVTDRGPNKRLVKEGRIIDLSKRAFEDICDLRKGLTKVEVRVKYN